MDPPDKKRAQPTTSDSTPSPPSKRRQLSRAAAANQWQSAATPGHTTAMAAAAAPSVEATVTGPPIAAGRTSSATSRLPAQRCPSDPLSVALSFLGVRDFAVASRVCRHWHRAADLQSAWPEFSIDRLIRNLIEDDRHWIQSRSLRLNADRLRVGELERAALIPKWRRLAGLHVYSSSTGREEEYKWVTLGRAALLPHLQSLRLEKVRLDDVDAAFSAMAPRLQAFHCCLDSVNKAVQPHVHLLVNLRVLVLGDVDAQALLPLHQLEYLHLGHIDSSSRDLLLAIRRLSVQHRLRHLSLTPYWGSTLDLDPLAAELDGPDSGLEPAALISIRLRCDLSDASPSVLLSLPNLTRLDWSGRAAVDDMPTDQRSSLPPSPLQQLHLGFYCHGGSVAHLLQQVAIRAPQLRELHITNPAPSIDQLIRPLRNLRLLDVALRKSSPLSPELLQSLASLPLFSELIVRQYSLRQQPFPLTLESLRGIAASPSWRLIRLIGPGDPLQLALPTAVDAHLAQRLADLRVQIGKPVPVSVYRLVVGEADGKVAWLQTAM